MKYTPLDGRPDCTSSCTSVLLPLNQGHHLCTFPSFMTSSPYTLTSRWWISAGQMFFAFEVQITERTSQPAGLVIDMVLYKALRHSNQFTQWLSKHWGRGRGSEDSSQPSKTSSQWPAQAECANGSYFKNDIHIICSSYCRNFDSVKKKNTFICMLTLQTTWHNLNCCLNICSGEKLDRWQVLCSVSCIVLLFKL